jgi:hypothetical protein
MDAHTELLNLYEEWKGLTEKEGAAILELNWAEVRSCQKTKQQLQPRIIRATDAAKNAPGQGSEFQARIRHCVNELILMETRNSEALEKRLEAAENEMNSLDRTSYRLKQVQKSYTGARAPSWNQYS